MNIGKVRAFVSGGGVCEVCVLCFSEDPSGEFSPRGDRFPQNKNISLRGELRGYYGIRGQGLERS